MKTKTVVVFSGVWGVRAVFIHPRGLKIYQQPTVASLARLAAECYRQSVASIMRVCPLMTGGEVGWEAHKIDLA